MQKIQDSSLAAAFRYIFWAIGFLHRLSKVCDCIRAKGERETSRTGSQKTQLGSKITAFWRGTKPVGYSVWNRDRVQRRSILTTEIASWLEATRPIRQVCQRIKPYWCWIHTGFKQQKRDSEWKWGWSGNEEMGRWLRRLPEHWWVSKNVDRWIYDLVCALKLTSKTWVKLWYIGIWSKTSLKVMWVHHPAPHANKYLPIWVR